MLIAVIAGVIVLAIGILALYEYVADPSSIDTEAAGEVGTESADAHEHALFAHKREVADALKEEIDEGYSEQ